jgi:hypothetical protein
MPLTRLAQECQSGTCPCVYEDDDGDIVVQGDVVAGPAGVELTGREGLVKIPRAVFLDAAGRLPRASDG